MLLDASNFSNVNNIIYLKTILPMSICLYGIDSYRRPFCCRCRADTHIAVGDVVNVLGSFDSDNTCMVTDSQNLIVVNPDLLISGTSVVSGVFCMRK